MSYTLLVFDLDGTLVDSLPDIAGALNHALAAAGREPLPLSDVRACVGEGVLRLAGKALSLRPGPPDGAAAVTPEALAEAIRAHYRAHPCVHSRVYSGMSEVLQALRADPARKTAVLTNKPSDITRGLLGALGLSDVFDAIIGDGDGYPRKPDPAALRMLATRFAVEPTRTLMVGDGIPDLQVARALPCDAAAALWGYSAPADLLSLNPRHRLSTPTDLLPLI